MKITKRIQGLIDARTTRLAEYLVGQGARLIAKRSNGLEFELVTPAGPWRVTLYDNWIATRFISQRGYRIVTDRHASNAKWNAHFEHDATAEEALRLLTSKTSLALACRPSEVDRGLIALAVVEYVKRMQELRECLEERGGRWGKRQKA